MANSATRPKNSVHARVSDGLGIIAGYSVFNDGSIREYQRKTSQWTIGKNFDATGGFGPDFVTADELPADAAAALALAAATGNPNPLLAGIRRSMDLVVLEPILGTSSVLLLDGEPHLLGGLLIRSLPALRRGHDLGIAIGTPLPRP